MSVSAVSLSNDLLGDFYQTFQLSQGSSRIQTSLFTGLATYYHNSVSTMALLPEACEVGQTQVSKLYLPETHNSEDMTRKIIRDEFSKMWRQYSSTILGIVEGTPLVDESVLSSMLQRDLDFQKNPRPNRLLNDDPHISLVREYILKDNLEGSPALISLRDRLRNAFYSPAGVEGEIMLDQLGSTIQLWESNHIGHSFVPPVVTTK